MNLSVLIVDDSEVNLMLFRHLVTRIEGLVPLCFDASQKALDWSAANDVDVVIVDYMMPAPDGIEFIRRFRAMDGKKNLPVIMITANELKAVRYEALESGATDFLTKPVDKNEFIARIRNMAALRRSQRLLADRAAHLAEEVAAATATIVDRERETILRLSKAAEYRDPEMGEHTLRIAHYSVLIAERLGLPADEQRMLFDAAPMHDIGMVGIPDSIALKPGPLTDAELAVMRRHPEIGYGILCDSTSPILKAAATIALIHHERCDGGGYPHGLKGDAIPLHGRIVAVADAFDDFTSARPNKPAWDPGVVKALLQTQSGSHFDPDCMTAFLAAWKEVIGVRDRLCDASYGAGP